MSQFIQVPSQSLLSYAPEQILGTSHRETVKSCQAWAELDPKCQFYNYNTTNQTCTKLQARHDYDTVLGIRLDPKRSCPYGKYVQQPFLILPATSFNFIPQHKIISTTVEATLKDCQSKLSQNPLVQFFTYNVSNQKCVAYSGIPDPNNTIGVRVLGPLDSICGDQCIQNNKKVLVNLQHQVNQAGRSKNDSRHPSDPLVYYNAADMSTTDTSNISSSQPTQSNSSWWNSITNIFTPHTGQSQTSLYLVLFLSLLLILWIYWSYKRASTSVIEIEEKQQHHTNTVKKPDKDYFDYRHVNELPQHFVPPITMYNNPFM